MRSTLLLNASYEPLSVVPAQRAVTLLARDKAVSLDDSPEIFRAGSVSFPVPYVALLKEQKKTGRHRAPSYSRHGVLVRDSYTCQYCGRYGDTIDHVVPQSLGGASSFENCVAACKSCNGKKANKTLEQIGWRLPVAPVVPSFYESLLSRARSDNELHSAWSQYISWYVPSLKVARV